MSGSRGRSLLHGHGTFSTSKVGGWRLAVGGGWRRLAVGGPWGLSLTTKKKEIWLLQGPNLVARAARDLGDNRGTGGIVPFVNHPFEWTSICPAAERGLKSGGQSSDWRLEKQLGRFWRVTNRSEDRWGRTDAVGRADAASLRRGEGVLWLGLCPVPDLELGHRRQECVGTGGGVTCSSVLSVVPRHCARLTHFLHPKSRNISAVLITLSLIPPPLRRLRRAVGAHVHVLVLGPVGGADPAACPTARNLGNYRGTGGIRPFVNRTFEWGGGIATFSSVLSVVPRHCARLTSLLHPKSRKIKAVRITPQTITPSPCGAQSALPTATQARRIRNDHEGRSAARPHGVFSQARRMPAAAVGIPRPPWRCRMALQKAWKSGATAQTHGAQRPPGVRHA